VRAPLPLLNRHRAGAANAQSLRRNSEPRPEAFHRTPRSWSGHGAEPTQPVAIAGKPGRSGNDPTTCDRLPTLATNCDRYCMVRRGSTVRVRQRASKTSCKSPNLSPEMATVRLSADTFGHIFVERGSPLHFGWWTLSSRVRRFRLDNRARHARVGAPASVPTKAVGLHRAVWRRLGRTEPPRR
jgi:hypothetical protein